MKELLGVASGEPKSSRRVKKRPPRKLQKRSGEKILLLLRQPTGHPPTKMFENFIDDN